MKKETIVLVVSIFFSLNLHGQWIEVEAAEGSIPVRELISHQQNIFASKQCGLFVKRSAAAQWERLDFTSTRNFQIRRDTMAYTHTGFWGGFFGIRFRDLSTPNFDTLKTVERIFNQNFYSHDLVFYDSLLLVATDNGVVALHNLGDSIFYLNKGLPVSYTLSPTGDSIPNLTVRQIEKLGQSVYAFTDTALYRHNLDTNGWQQVSGAYISSSFGPTKATIASNGMFLMAINNVLYRSIDTGKTWQNIFQNNSTSANLDYQLTSTSIIATNGPNFLERSNDFGMTWQSANNGLRTRPLYLTSAQDTFYLSTQAGFKKDMGGLWQDESQKGMACVQSVSNLASNGMGLYMSDDVGVYRYNDTNAWKRISPLDSQIVRYTSLAALPGEVWVAGTYLSGPNNTNVDSVFIRKSNDNGQTWRSTKWSFGNPRELIIRERGNAVYATDGQNLYQSFAGSSVWLNLSQRFYSEELNFFNNKLWYLQSRTNNRIVSFDLSTNQNTFYTLPTPTNVPAFSRFFTRDTLLYITNGDTTFAKGPNSGWVPVPGAPAELVSGVSFRDQLFTVTFTGPVYKADTNQQNQWYPVADTIPSGGIVTGQITIYRDTFFVTTADNIFKLGIPDSLLVSLNEESPSNLYSLYPNPANSSLTLNGPAGGPLQLEIHTAEGRLCFRASVQTKQRINLPELPAGLYWLSLKGDEGLRETHRLMIE